MFDYGFYTRMMHLLDEDKKSGEDKRLEGHLTEAVFRRLYGSKFFSSEAVFGVIKFKREWDGNKFANHWLFPSDNGWEVPAPLKALMHIRKYDNYYMYSGSVLDCDVGFIKLVVRKVTVSAGGMHTLESALSLEDLQETINNKLLKLVGKSPSRSWFGDFLPAMYPSEIQALYISRCIMNFGDVYAVDVDALDVDANKWVRVYEFKRKLPAESLLYPHKSYKISDYHKLAKAVGGIRLQGVGTPREELLKKILLIEPYKLRFEPCYGLDWRSHTSNYMDVVFSRGAYSYIVWRRKRCSIYEMISLDLEVKGSFDLYFCDVVPNDFCGFNVTDPRNSGTFSNKPRIQNMIPESRFKPVVM
ncbi:hypothetical protein [Pseudomonas sp. NPDC090201]|uniref:hypothetical protein n=1 Tax=Pseudomonas sp. NPDC090201 TaxID=3364475 RepID=UPI003818DF9A